MHNLNIGIVADWLVTYAGSEKVIKEFLEVFPESELYSIVDFYPMRIELISRKESNY